MSYFLSKLPVAHTLTWITQDVSRNQVIFDQITHFTEGKNLQNFVAVLQQLKQKGYHWRKSLQMGISSANSIT